MNMKGLFTIIAVFVLSACNSTQSGLYWGNYSDTLYQYKLEPGEKTRSQHIKSLQDVIAKSDKKGLRVPPGVLIELAIMEIESGNSEAAVALLDREVSIYPESAVLVSMLKQRMEG